MYLCSFMEALNGYFAVALERAKEIIARGDKGGRGTHLVGRIREVMELGDGIWGGRAGRGG